MEKLKREIWRFKHYFPNLILIWLVFAFYHISNFYSDFLRQETKILILYLAIAYTLMGFFFYLYRSPEKNKPTKGTLIFNLIQKTIKSFSKNTLPKIEHAEKTAFLFVIVKIIFLPVMLNFFFQNLHFVLGQIQNLTSFSSLFTTQNFNYLVFPFLLTLIFMVDTLWFSFGYAFEAGFLKNRIRSVEPTFLGWFVALICYPPLNGMLGKYIGWYSNEFVFFSSDTLTVSMRILIILSYSIYLGATLALGTKCSNLTNRGIVTKWPYSIVRHPAYITKNLAWWLTIIPIASIPAVAVTTVWSVIYHLRAVTEENHLIKDPDYVEYCKKVRYRYIPGVY